MQVGPTAYVLLPLERLRVVLGHLGHHHLLPAVVPNLLVVAFEQQRIEPVGRRIEVLGRAAQPLCGGGHRQELRVSQGGRAGTKTGRTRHRHE